MWVANRRLNILNSINYRAVLLHAGSSQEDVTASIAETEDFLRNLSFPGLSEKEKEVIAEEIKEYHKERYNKLDEGSFTDVYLDKFKGNVVRKFKDSVSKEHKRKELVNHFHIQHMGDHPNVVKVLKTEFKSISMEFGHLHVLDPQTKNSYRIPVNLVGFVTNTYKLKALDTRRKILNLLTGYNMYSQLINGLEYLHSNNVVHRDIKPDNILVCGEWGGNMIFKYADFGLSVILAPNRDYSDYIKEVGNIGSVEYCSPPAPKAVRSDQYPEVLKILFSSDYWSLMVTFYAATYAISLFRSMPIRIRNKQDPNYLRILRGDPPMYANKHKEIDTIIQNEVFNNCIEGTEEEKATRRNMKLYVPFTKTLYYASKFEYEKTIECVKQCNVFFQKLQPCITGTEF